MIFKHTWSAVLRGDKSETRRPARESDKIRVKVGDVRTCKPDELEDDLPLSILEVFRSARLMYQVGKSYAIQAGRGNRSIGRFTLRELVVQRLGDISDVGAMAEGVQRVIDGDRTLYKFSTADNMVFRGDDPVDVYLAGWEHLYPKSNKSDLVYVLRWSPAEVEAYTSGRSNG